MILHSFLGTMFLSTISLGVSEHDHAVDKRSFTRSPYCVDKFYAIKGHTMCKGVPSRRPDTTERQLIETKLNDIRTNVKPTATNMLYAESLLALGYEAQIWADQCVFEHDESSFRFFPGVGNVPLWTWNTNVNVCMNEQWDCDKTSYTRIIVAAKSKPRQYTVGQNLLISKGVQLNWTEVLDIWAAENASFTYGSSRNKIEDVGNYTQMVLAELYGIGCGWSKCKDVYLYVCNFAPSIKPDLMSKPYNSGPSCGDCQTNYTASNLCDCVGRFCINGGKLNVTTCECDCLDGNNRYDPEYCGLFCIPNGDNVKCGRPPWTNDTCTTNTDTVFNCPWLCQICPYAGRNYTRGSATMPWTTILPSTVASSPSTVASSPVRAATASKGLDNGGPHAAITHGMLIAVVFMTMFFM